MCCHSVGLATRSVRDWRSFRAVRSAALPGGRGAEACGCVASERLCTWEPRHWLQRAANFTEPPEHCL